MFLIITRLSLSSHIRHKKKAFDFSSALPAFIFTLYLQGAAAHVLTDCSLNHRGDALRNEQWYIQTELSAKNRTWRGVAVQIKNLYPEPNRYVAH